MDEYPSLLWITIPPILIISAYFTRKWYLLKYRGIGKGAPGFQTNVGKVRVPREIVEALRRGEEVTAEMITAAQNREKVADKGRDIVERDDRPQINTESNEWLPESITAPRKRGKGRKK